MFQQKFFGFIAVISILATLSYAKSSEVEVPRTALKDQFKYYILSDTKQATVHQVSLKRLSYDTILYIKVEINCPSRMIREMGYNVNSLKAISTNKPSQWYQPTIGSAQADIITFVCR